MTVDQALLLKWSYTVKLKRCSMNLHRCSRAMPQRSSMEPAALQSSYLGQPNVPEQGERG